jgi:hypothetical protein
MKMKTQAKVDFDGDDEDGTTVIRFESFVKGYHTEKGVLPHHLFSVEFDATDAVLGDLVTQVEYFLKAQGYGFDHLEIVHTERVAEVLEGMKTDRYGEGYDKGYKQGYKDAHTGLGSNPWVQSNRG